MGIVRECGRNQGEDSLQSRLAGGEGGILLPPSLLSGCDPYTSAIIHCYCEAYQRIRSLVTVSIVSPIYYSSAENSIIGISRVHLESHNGIRFAFAEHSVV
jgi:hypothetical protein